jgi:hypothetical protein
MSTTQRTRPPEHHVASELERIAAVLQAQLSGSALFPYLENLVVAIDRLRVERTRMEKLIEDIAPPITEPSTAALAQARRNAYARRRFVEEWGGLTGEEAAALAGSTAKNRAATASRWKQNRRVFAVPYTGKTYFPAFQFDQNGEPKPVIHDILGVLQEHYGPWEIGLWFTAANGILGGKRPVDILDKDSEKVLAAARYEADELGG